MSDQQSALNLAVEKFLKKWPEVETRINGEFGLQQARTGYCYSGPTIGHEIDELVRCAKVLGLDTKAKDTHGNQDS